MCARTRNRFDSRQERWLELVLRDGRLEELSIPFPVSGTDERCQGCSGYDFFHGAFTSWNACQYPVRQSIGLF